MFVAPPALGGGPRISSKLKSSKFSNWFSSLPPKLFQSSSKSDPDGVDDGGGLATSTDMTMVVAMFSAAATDPK